MKNIYLAVRTDGIDGVGSMSDPRDASTSAKFDAIFKTPTPGATYYLIPGQYLTRGAKFGVQGLTLGNRLIGSGMLNTSIKIDPAWDPADAGYNAGNNVAVVGSFWTGPEQKDAMAYQYVSDLTLDCNWSYLQHERKNAKSFGHIALAGDHTIVERVRYLSGFNGPKSECFPVELQGAHGLVRDCFMGEWQKNGNPNAKGTTFFAFGDYGTLERCLIDVADLEAGPPFYANGVAFYRKGTTVRNCTFKASETNMIFSACYGDSGGGETRNWVVEGNHFLNVVYGVAAMFGDIKIVGAKIISNDFLITGSPGSPLDSGALRSDASLSGTPSWENVIFAGNTVRQNTPGHSAIRITAPVSVTNLLIAGNLPDPGMVVVTP